MKTLGIITEYNPFHLGHKYHIKESKLETGLDYTVVVMSGNAVQRGDFALIDKFERAKEAVLNGGDLVLELPYVYSGSSAEIFAKGNIEILNNLGIIDSICFGSESNNIKALKELASILAFESDALQKEIKQNVQKGHSFPKARELALINHISDPIVLQTSNDILGIEYIKNIYREKSDIKPVSIKRISSNYHDTNIDKAMPSATAIRQLLKSKDIEEIQEYLKKSTPPNMAEILYNEYQNNNLMNLENFFEELKLIIIREGKSISKYFEINEGIENLILKSAIKSNTLEELIQNVKSKRYTYTRIRRMLMNILIGLTKEDMKLILENNELPPIRVLAFNDKGRALLKSISKKLEENNRIITKLADYTPLTEKDKLIRKYENIVNTMYYSKYIKVQKGKRVLSDIVLSPIYIK